MTSLLELLRGHAERAPGRPAVLAPGRLPTSYEDLARHVQAMTEELRARGIGADDRVVVALPNGPDLAVAVLGTIAAAQCAPLAIDHPRAQFARELTNLNARAVLVQRGTDTDAREAAADVGVPIIELEAGAAAGCCTMEEASSCVPGSRHGTTTGADAALLLFTSGTTSDPKLVPLTETGLLRSAETVAATLGLTDADRCLNVMPLFHIHGLVAALLASLAVGGSVVCTPGFRANSVREWVEEYAPTWYTAVPTIHQAMLDVTRSSDLRGAFRFIRSSSAALPPRVLRELEDAFGAPVIEAYGMTEAAHQMASNPLPPGSRRPGTVGRATGVDIAVLDLDGSCLPAGEVGELVIKGPTVMSGYVDNPEANAGAYVDGWFRTGDQGRIDADGYVTITGRLKEIINRGGEKVAPREVDEALLTHPDVRSASAFAIPHPRLGEEVAAAVVLAEGALVTTAQLRRFVAAQLEPYKVPRRVVVVDDIPRGPTGKIERRRLGAALGFERAARGSTDAATTVPPRDDHEMAVALLWQRVLGLDVLPSVEDDFFDLGGDSLHATELLHAVEDDFGRSVPATIFAAGATVRVMAEELQSVAPGDCGPSIVPIQPHGSRPGLFCLLRGGSIVTARHFVPALGSDQPIYGIWYPAMHGSRSLAGSIEDIAQACLAVIRQVQRHGPYLLFGHSLGGLVMYDVARQLTDQGEVVSLLALADSAHPRFVAPEWRRRAFHMRRWVRKALSPDALRMVRAATSPGGRDTRRRQIIVGSNVRLDLTAVLARERNYRPSPAGWPVAIFSTQAWRDYANGPDLGWKALLGDWTSHPVPGNHDSMIAEPHVHILAAELAERLGVAHPNQLSARRA